MFVEFAFLGSFIHMRCVLFDNPRVRLLFRIAFGMRFVSIELSDLRLLFYGFVSCFFQAHRSCSIDSWVAVAITLHLILLILTGRFYARFSSFGTSRISFGDIVLFSFFSRTSGTGVPFGSFFEFRFHGFLSAAWLRR